MMPRLPGGTRTPLAATAGDGRPPSAPAVTPAALAGRRREQLPTAQAETAAQPPLVLGELGGAEMPRSRFVTVEAARRIPMLLNCWSVGWLRACPCRGVPPFRPGEPRRSCPAARPSPRIRAVPRLHGSPRSRAPASRPTGATATSCQAPSAELRSTASSTDWTWRPSANDGRGCSPALIAFTRSTTWPRNVLPVMVKNYGWGEKTGCGEDSLIEHYAYTEIEVSDSMSPTDFDPKNKKYYGRLEVVAPDSSSLQLFT